MRKELIVVVLGFSLLISTGQYGKLIEAQTEAITLSITGGPPGTEVTISGSGFSSSVSGDVWFDSNDDGIKDVDEPSVSVTTSSTGTFDATLIIPSVAFGAYNIKADVPSGGAVEASAKFIVGELTFINIDLSNTLNPTDLPIGIECGDPNFVYVTIRSQGLLVKIDKTTREVVAFFDQPDEAVVGGQNFFSITRDVDTGDLYMNEVSSGELWRFNPFTETWTRIPIVEKIIHPLVTYTPGYEIDPEGITVDESGAPGVPPLHSPHTYSSASLFVFGETHIKFDQGNVWVPLSYFFDFDDFANAVGVSDVKFAGLVKVNADLIDIDPENTVKRILIPSERVYRDVDGSGTVTAGDIRLANPISPFTDGSVVAASDPDVGSPLVAFSSDEKHTDTGDNANVFDIGETIYGDLDNSDDVSAGDIRLANAFTDGSVVAASDPDVGSPLVAFSSDEKHTDTGDNANVFDIGASRPTGLAIDMDDPNILWVTDRVADKIFKFDTLTETVIQTIDLRALIGPNSFPTSIDTDSNNIYVALNKPSDLELDFIQDNFSSEIAVINKSTLAVSIIDTGAPLPDPFDNFGFGTFTVFVNNGLLVWTDQANISDPDTGDFVGHVGFIDVTTTPPTVFPFFNTKTFTNHFGCVPFNGEFWFAGEGSAEIGILPHSKFSVGVGVGRARPTSGGGGGGHAGRHQPFSDPSSPNYDGEAPLIGEVFTVPGSLTVYTQISDKVGVKDANIILDKKTSIPMEFHMGSVNWWFGTIPSSKLPASGTLFFKIVARDFNDNVAEYSGSADISAGSSSSSGAFMISALPYQQQTNPAYSITANVAEFDSSIPATITIKNTSNEQLQNIRIMLSPELRGKFLLSEYAVKSIDPNSEYTVSIMLNGKSNIDAMKQPIQYRGQIIISVDNRTPYIYELSGKAPNDYSLNLFMNNIISKAEQRYKTFSKPDQRISNDANYQVTLGSGNDAIRSASDELIINNIGDKPLKNLRIITSTLGNHFLPDQRNISFIPAGSYVKVKLLSNLNSNESPELYGQLLIVPEVGMPVTIPIEIGKVAKEDRNAKYEVTTLSGDNVVSNTADGIIIRNNSDQSINNVRIILPKELSAVFSVSEDSFKSIEPNDEKVVYLQQRGTIDSVSKQIVNNYHGQIIIVSENGMQKLVPVEVAWKNISSKHFIVYARNNADELIKATHLVNFLERNYGRVIEIIGESTAKTNTKMVIYMPTSLDEMRKISDTQTMSTYMNNEDIAFVYSKSEDINALALKEFVYRMVMKNHATYWTGQKVSMDRGNWLVDGLSNYVAARIVGERGMISDQINAFVDEPVSLEWYGSGTLSQYGATYALFEFLSEKYGDTVIDRTLYYLGSSMISNHRCDTFEQCTLLRAVYDVKGLDINEKRHDFTFSTIIEEWQGYLESYTRSN
jgi:hypothetical protein